LAFWIPPLREYGANAHMFARRKRWVKSASRRVYAAVHVHRALRPPFGGYAEAASIV
jgi:hypothetical protein